MSQTGTVQRFNRIKGYGFIISDENQQEVFVHFSEVQGSGYKELTSGQRVSYTLKTGEKGDYATQVQVID
ncbi:Cold shock-like protein CspD [Legionella birminghamensis]|uniref:Cold shock-like protein CspD n=1 Tax=Legionella birminghamensis TaxID=28083 RepID=A0A378IIW8_9GAMM|nr:cold-shock protein [Legionella birminghamensis]KTC75988.1 Cold shock-like protein CspD [Legionella birminghamensis]STX32114.1 Cold shock-like protein CspD [Legionella birminghamensis]